MNDPMSRMVAAVRGGENPRNVVMQLARTDPQFAQVERMISGKSTQQMQSMVLNMCKERGTTPEELARQYGLL